MTSAVATREMPEALAEMIREIAAIADSNLQDGRGTAEEFVAGIMTNILNAETFEDVFAAQDSGGISGKDFTNRPFTILSNDDIIWAPSDLESSPFPFYAIMKVHPLDDPDNEVSVSCGGLTFVATIYTLMKRGYFDAVKYPEGRSLILTSTDATNGAYLSLRPFAQPKRATRK